MEELREEQKNITESNIITERWLRDTRFFQ
jgi:hypothetical protein